MSSDADVEFYSLDLARLPDPLYRPEVPLKEWQKHAKTAGGKGFPAGSLGDVAPISWRPLLERLVTFPLYMLLNAAPFMVPPVLCVSFGLRGAGLFLLGLVALHGLLAATNPMGSVRSGQYLYTERNIQKYCSIKWVWPKSLQPPSTPGPKIFCTIPHGLAPIGVTSYPVWSKLFGDVLCHWTCAPVVLKLPIISYLLRHVGYVVASAGKIREVLTKKEESIGVVLDGIPGMFQLDGKVEKGFVRSRKGIVKIALTTGVPLVPVYCFGTSSLWRIIVDPFGILQKISIALDVSVTPFSGRPFGLLPFGPPFRCPVLVAFGDPVVVPKVDQPSQAQIDEYHGKLLEGFLQVFERHKAAYGWPSKKLELI